MARNTRSNQLLLTHLTIVNLTVNINLTFSNVTGKIRDRMCNIIIRHCKYRNLSDGAVSASHTPSSLVDCGKICIHITGETTTTWHFFSGCGHLHITTLAFPLKNGYGTQLITKPFETPSQETTFRKYATKLVALGRTLIVHAPHDFLKQKLSS